MFRRGGKFLNDPNDKDSRFERLGVFALAVFLLQGICALLVLLVFVL